MARKSSPQNLHKVLHKGNSKFPCDRYCVEWATKFGTHTLTAAKDYEETVLSVNKVALQAKPNVTSLADLNMPKSRGEKATKSTS